MSLNRSGIASIKRGTKLSEKHKKALSIAHFKRIKQRGSTHWNWKGGITPSYLTERRGEKYIKWRTEIFKRDDYICQICKKRGGKISADHIIPFSISKELRYELSNGRTLCWDCHKKTDTFAGRIIKYKKDNNYV